MINWPTAFAIVGTVFAFACLLHGFPVFNFRCTTVNNFFGDDGDEEEMSNIYVNPPAKYQN